ncbi:hypothetical protein ACX80V_03920 [Arthrobacter sp. MDT3-24]
MPIVYVHGVATRDNSSGYRESWEAIETLLREYIAPVITDRPDDVAVEIAYWGDLAASTPLGGLARPRGRLFGLGAGDGDRVSAALMAEFAGSFDPLGLPSGHLAQPDRLAPSGPAQAVDASTLRDLGSDELSDLLIAAMPEDPASFAGTQVGDADASAAAQRRMAAWAIAADEVARDPSTRAGVEECEDLDAEVDYFFGLVEARYQGPTDSLIGLGAGQGWPSAWRQRVSESVSRLTHVPGFVLSRAMAEVRGPLNDAVTTFLGDVFVYLAGRGTPGDPGPIPAAVLETMRRAASHRLVPDEPMIVVTHSMGGQIIYDLATSFLEREPDAAQLRIDFWCAAASQVGLFQELDLFVSHPPRNQAAPAPSRDRLGHWWNVWDYNDFLSYSAAGIVEGVNDESYSSGLSLLSAHGGYLKRPSFYRRFAEKLRAVDWLDGGGPE